MKDKNKQSSSDATKSRQGLNKPKPKTKKEKFQYKMAQYHWEDPVETPFEPQIQSIEIGDNVIGENDDKRDISLNYLRVPLLIFQDSKRNLTDILLYCRIYDLARNDKEKDSSKRRCWGDDEYLALPLNLSFSTMRRSLDRLLKSGLVKKVQDFEEREAPLPDIPRLLAPQKNFFKKNDGQNAQYIRLYYGLFYDDRLSREIILLYSYIYSQSNAPWNVAQYGGYYTFSFSQESKKFNYSFKTLSKYLKQMNELGLIELYVYRENSPIVKPRFDLDKYFNFNNNKSESKPNAPRVDDAFEDDFDNETGDTLEHEEEDVDAQEAQEKIEEKRIESDTDSCDNSPIDVPDIIGDTPIVDSISNSIPDSTPDSTSPSSPSPIPNTSTPDTATTNSLDSFTSNSSPDTLDTPDTSNSIPSPSISFFVTIDDDFEF